MNPRLPVTLVYKKSQLALALENKNARIQGLLDDDDVSVRPMRDADEAHNATLAAVTQALRKAKLPTKRIYRARLRPEHCEGRLLVTVGGDGTLLDASHKVQGAFAGGPAGCALGVNSDTAHSTGFLCAARGDTFAAVLDDILSGALEPTRVRRLSGHIDGVPLPFPVLNDVLVSHKNPAATSKYIVTALSHSEEHKSSGAWLSTATGSTAAMSSAGGVVQTLSDQRLQWRVRELFREPALDVVTRPQWRLDAFFIDGDDEVVITSKMREGRVWLDGPHWSADLAMGARLTLHGRVAPLPLYATAAMGQRRERLLAPV
jgi:NAD+ kinase